MSEIPEALADSTVAELWDGNGWKWDLFSHLLPPDMLLRIQSISLTDNTQASDQLSWTGSSSGHFTVKSAYGIINPMPIEDHRSVWNKLWKVEAPQRTLNFLWLALHNSFLCNEVRVRRHIASCSACTGCGAPVESCLHVLRDCPAAREVWTKLNCPMTFDDFFSQESMDWIESNISCEGSWPTIFTIACWWIWRWRNNRAFGNNNLVPDCKEFFILNQVDGYKAALVRSVTNRNTCKRKRTLSYIRWESPPLGWAKLNTDGAARGNPGPAGAGGILRNDLSGFVKGFALKCGMCTSVKAELFGVLKGLVMAKDLNITNLILEVDSEVVVNAIIMEPEDCNPNYFLILQCRALINQDDWEVRIKHTYREANAVADWFANESFSCSNNVTYFDSPPTGVMSLLVDDVIDCSKPRMIVT